METTGNYTTQPDRGFPLDCETLAQLERNTALACAVGNMGGDRVVLTGCTLSEGGGSRSRGYVFLRTAAFPEGEVLEWVGGDISGGMHIELEDVAVTCQGRTYAKAYVKRRLVPGVGEENYDWEGFADVLGVRELREILEALEREIEEARAQRVDEEPAGVVKLWAGSGEPEGYALCDGRQLRTEAYPVLSAALGGAFNAGADANGNRYTTDTGYFRIPDLRGRFIAGVNPVDDDYNAAGKTGGEKEHMLTTEEIPAHRHKQYYRPGSRGDWKSGGSDSWPDATTAHDRWSERNTALTGGGMAHENRPPYYTLAYIIKLH